jgi:OmpA-OmpF porin, OOP family
MFDMLIREVAAKFGLGDKAGWILSTLLGFMFQKQSGGLSGFLDLFKQKGLASIATSWLGGKGLPQEINSTQLENAIGGNLIKDIASKTGLASGPIGSALAFMLPKIVRGLTPDGTIPTGIPSAISQYLGTTTEKAATPTPTPRHAPPPTPMAAESKGFPWWWILIPLILLLGWCAMRKPADAPAPVVEPPKPAAQAPAPVAQINPKLVVNNDGGKFYYNGTVGDDAAKTSLIDAFKSALGDSASGEIVVDKNAKGANWLGMLGKFLPELKSIGGAKLTLDGDDITLDGSMPQGDIDGLMGKLKSIFGDKFNIKSMAQALVAAAPAAPEAPKDDATKNAEAGAKMDALAAAGNISGEDLVKALNLAIIHFATGSANISADSMDVLKKAAATLKAAAPGTKVEIGGHTDNAGNPASNMKLSDARSKSVMTTLVKLGVDAAMLTAKGFGDTKPVAPNDTPEGKAQNRRMEFSLAQ